jgi:[methyl-Co(III) methanol-specific corrinoid protein]:coenzyme M methyltransferase
MSAFRIPTDACVTEQDPSSAGASMGLGGTDMMTERQIVVAAIEMQETDRPSSTGTGVITVDGIMKSGVNPATMWHDGKAMALLAKTAHDMCGFEDVSLFMIWTHLEALGAVVNYKEGKGVPYLEKSPLVLGGEYVMPDMDKYMKLAPVVRTVEAFKTARKLAGKDTALTGMTSWGPLTTAGHLAGTEALMLGIATDPDEVKRLIKFVADYNCEAYKAELSAGYIDDLDYLTPGEPSASGDLLSPDMFAEYSLPYLQQEIKAIRSTNNRVQLHICGDTTNHLPLMAQSGAQALSIEEKVDPYVAVKAVGGKVGIVGNVGPVNPLLQGTPEQVVKDTLRCIDAGFRAIQPGCAVAPGTPTANLRAMATTTKASHHKLLRKV